MLSYDILKEKPTLFQTFTTLTHAEFLELLVEFNCQWHVDTQKRSKQRKSRKRKAGGGRKSGLTSMADRLLFILMYLKLYPIQELHGFLFGLSQSQTNRLIHRSAAVLRRALKARGDLPEREGAQLEAALRACESLTCAQDASERRRQRPKKEQKQYYSGKKKCHTIKNHLVVHPEHQRICYLSKTNPGKVHDKRLADESGLVFPDNTTVEQDTGYQGYEQDNIIIVQPKKKPRGQELTVAEQFINKAISSSRVIVENVIASVKRCRIVKDVLRNWKTEFDDVIMEIACGLHNLRVESRHPISTIRLIELI